MLEYISRIMRNVWMLDQSYAYFWFWKLLPNSLAKNTSPFFTPTTCRGEQLLSHISVKNPASDTINPYQFRRSPETLF